MTLTQATALAAYQYATVGTVDLDVLAVLAAHGWDVDAYLAYLDNLLN